MDGTALSIPAPGPKLHARERNPHGSPAVLFLHGWLDNAHGFDWVCDALPESLRLISLDFRGHGRSDHLPEGCGYTLVGYLADVAAALEATSVQRIHLVGHSLGGTVALMFAAARPEAVASVTSIESLGPSGGPPEQAVERLRTFVSELGRSPRKRAYSNVEDAALKLRENNPGLSEAAALHLASTGTTQTGAGFLFAFDPALRKRSGMVYDEAQWLAVLGAVRAPCQVIRGTRGYPADEAQVRARLKALRDPEVIAVEGGHHAHLDRPADVARAIQAFVAAHP